MRMKRHKIYLTLVILVSGICSMPYMLYKGLYLYEMRFLPEQRSPVQHDTIPDFVLDMAWIRLDGLGKRQMIPIRFDHWVRLIVGSDLRHPIPMSRTVAGVAADTVIRNDPNRTTMRNLQWHAYSASVTIWVSHHWTIDEALATIVMSSYYGHESWGIEQAAMTYFEKSLQQISVAEAAVLMAPLQLPALYDPWCRPARTLEQVNMLLAAFEARSPLQRLPESLVVTPPDTCQ